MADPIHRVMILFRIMEKLRACSRRAYRAKSRRRILAHAAAYDRWRRTQMRYLKLDHNGGHILRENIFTLRRMQAEGKFRRDDEY